MCEFEDENWSRVGDSQKERNGACNMLGDVENLLTRNESEDSESKLSSESIS